MEASVAILRRWVFLGELPRRLPSMSKSRALTFAAPVRSTRNMPSAAKRIGWCSLAILVALYVVGAVSHGSLRHEMQTLPLWFPIVQGFRERPVAKWMALPCLVFWLTIMTLIWLFLLGWARVVSGTFSMTEIAMTIIIGFASLLGLSTIFRWRTSTGAGTATALLVAFALFQLLAFRISLISFIARQ